jgi:hypothetical protein
VTTKNGVFLDVTPVALVRTDVSDEISSSIIRAIRIGEVTLMMEEKVPPKRRFLQEPRGILSQKTPFFN